MLHPPIDVATEMINAGGISGYGLRFVEDPITSPII
jgi:hypothetical protein